MKEYLNRPIKEVIEEHPVVGDILNEFEIGCTTCNVGSCMLKDVVDIHFLPPEQESVLMERIEKAIQGGESREEQTPQPSQGRRTGKGYSYSEPVRMLVEEHDLIKRLLALIPLIVRDIRANGLDRELILDSLEFIRYFADRFHHAKEEEIMFEYADREADIIQVMYTDHTTGRNHVKSIFEALDGNDKETVIKHLQQYRDLLTEHIKKEDEVLYPWIEHQMDNKEIEAMHRAFNDEENRLGPETRARYEQLVKRLEQKLDTREEVQS